MLTAFTTSPLAPEFRWKFRLQLYANTVSVYPSLSFILAFATSASTRMCCVRVNQSVKVRRSQRYIEGSMSTSQYGPMAFYFPASHPRLTRTSLMADTSSCKDASNASSETDAPFLSMTSSSVRPTVSKTLFSKLKHFNNNELSSIIPNRRIGVGTFQYLFIATVLAKFLTRL